MKNYSRAYNRQQKQTKFLHRVKKWYSVYHMYNSGNYDLEIEQTLAGQRANFLKTTGRPCNCECCTYLKYKRPNNKKIINQDFSH